MAAVSFDGVTKTYPDGTTAVNGLDLEITDGEFMVLVGPSGCGKTTALRMVAGLEDISRGVLKIGERIVNHVPLARPRHRHGLPELRALSAPDGVRQHRVRAEIKKLPKDEIEKRVSEAARILDLEPYLKRKPARALRRPATAGRDGPRDRARAVGVPDGRAAVEPRREAARADARRDRAACSARSA